MSENSNDMTTPQEPIPAEPAAPVAPAAPLPAAAAAAPNGKGVRNYVLAGVSAVVGAVLVLGSGAIGYAIGSNDKGDDGHRGGEMSIAADRDSQQGQQRGDGSMMDRGDEYGMQNDGGMMDGHHEGHDMPGMDGQGGMGSRGMDPDGDNWSGQNRDGGMMGGGSGPMMQGNGIRDFLNQLQSGQGLSPDQQQFLDQLKGFVGGMRNQMG
jgi:hypothetical protein